jgi:hypothetical protein
MHKAMASVLASWVHEFDKVETDGSNPCICVHQKYIAIHNVGFFPEITPPYCRSNMIISFNVY